MLKQLLREWLIEIVSSTPLRGVDAVGFIAQVAIIDRRYYRQLKSERIGMVIP